MNDLEQDLRELFQIKSRVPPPTPRPPGLLRRARRRQVGTAFVAVLGGLAILGGAFFGARALVTSHPEVRPALPTAPEGFQSVPLPNVSIAYPEDWSLVADDPERTEDRILQLANLEFGVGWGNCEAGYTLPRGGVMLEVQLGGIQGSVPEWPVPLDVLPGPTRPCGADLVLGASWTASGRAFSATGLVTRDASREDVDLMTRAFESLTFPEVAPQTEEFIGHWSRILDVADSPVGPVVLYVYADLDDVRREEPSHWIGIAGPVGSRLAGASQIGRDPPSGDESITMNLDTWGGVVWGDVSSEANRAQLRTVEGFTFPAKLISLPRSIGVENHQAVWGIVEGETGDRVTTLLYDGQGNVLNDLFPVGARISIATGEDPAGGPWELYLDVTNDGTGLGFAFTDGGGGGGCCLRPLKEDFRLDGWGSGGDEPSNITALASDVIARIVFEGVDGTAIEGGLHPVPDESIGVPQVGLVIVPKDVPLEGDLVAYDADGNEVGREFVGETSEPAGPTPEIDAVWQALRAARDASARYFERESTFTTLSLDALVDLAKGPVTFSTRPEPEAVSVFVTDDRHLAMSSSAITGEEFCIAVEAPDSPNSSFNYRYGSVFAQSYDDCSGGW